MDPEVPVSTALASPPTQPPPRQAYRKLPGRMPTLRFAASGIKKLYLGDDHLLQVDTVFFVEHYRRFAYTDIQSLLMRRTARGWVLNLVLGGFVLLFGVLGVAVSDEVGRWVLWSIGGFFGLLLAVNATRGATCRCRLETAIGPQDLLSLSRVRPASKAFALLGERIAAAQGQFTPEEARERVDALLAGR